MKINKKKRGYLWNGTHEGIMLAKDLFSEVCELDGGWADFPSAGVGDAFSAQGASDDLVAEADA